MNNLFFGTLFLKKFLGSIWKYFIEKTNWTQAHQNIGIPECHDLAAVHERHRWGRGSLVIVTTLHQDHNTMHLFDSLNKTIIVQRSSRVSFKRGHWPLLQSQTSRIHWDEWHKSIPYDRTDWLIIHATECWIDIGNKSSSRKWINFRKRVVQVGRAALTRVCVIMTALHRAASAHQRKCSRADSAPSAKMSFSR